tara:strand:- start:1176 stop:1538 length:363 start_codon:yes stop_codon:yes gene_type:complete
MGKTYKDVCLEKWMKKRLFGGLLQNIAELKVLDVLLHESDRSFSLSELSREAGVSWSTLHRVFPGFVKENLVVKDKEVGRAKLYKLNKGNEAINHLVNAHHSFIVDDHHEYLNSLLSKNV